MPIDISQFDTDIQSSIKRAKAAGFRDDQVLPIAQKKQDARQPGLLGKVAEPFTKTLRTAGGAGFELGRVGGIVEQQAENPFLSQQELEAASDPRKALIDTAKRTAGIAAFGVPGGKAFQGVAKGVPGILGGAKLGGAALSGLTAGGLTGVSATKGRTAGELAGGAATGALTGAAVGGGLNLAGRGIKTAFKLGRNALESLSRRGAAEFLGRPAGGALGKGAEVGIDPINAFRDLSGKIKGNSVDDFIGPVAARGKGGGVGKLMGTLGDDINRGIKESGKKIVMSIDDITNVIKPSHKTLVDLGDAKTASKLIDVSNKIRRAHPNGLTLGAAVNFRRAVDSIFGKAVRQTEKGAIQGQVQKQIANTLRGVIARNSPSVGNAIGEQQKLFIVRDLLINARNKGLTSTPGFQRFNFMEPGAYADLLFKSKAVSKFFAGAIPVSPRDAFNEMARQAARLADEETAQQAFRALNAGDERAFRGIVAKFIPQLGIDDKAFEAYKAFNIVADAVGGDIISGADVLARVQGPQDLGVVSQALQSGPSVVSGAAARQVAGQLPAITAAVDATGEGAPTGAGGFPSIDQALGGQGQVQGAQDLGGFSLNPTTNQYVSNDDQWVWDGQQWTPNTGQQVAGAQGGAGGGGQGVSTGAFSQDQINQLLSAAVASGDPKLLDVVSKIVDITTKTQKLGGGKKPKLSATAQASVTESRNTLGLLDQIEDQFNEVQNLGLAATGGGIGQFGAVRGRIGATALFQNPTARAFEQSKESSLSFLARGFGQKGTLTDIDLDLIRGALPSFEDSPITAKRKMDAMRRTIQNNIDGIMQTADQSQTLPDIEDLIQSF